MTKQLYELEFSDKALNPNWMNIDNLRACLFGDTHTRPDLLQVRQVKPSIWRNIFIGLALASLIAIAMSCVLMAGLYMWDFSIMLDGV